MKPILLSPSEARILALRAQGLSTSAPFGSGKEGTLRAIEHMGYVQIDTISVVERAHHHVLWSRVPDYRPETLRELQVQDQTVFEYWSHAAAYVPMRDFRYCLPRMKMYADGKSHWFRKNSKLMNEILARIRTEGPLQARDFENPKNQKSGWWSWKPAKKALEQLFMEGRLVIRERRSFQKVYDLPERVIPSSVNTSIPTRQEMANYLALSAIRSHGLATSAEMRYLRRGWDRELKTALAELSEDGQITPVRVQSLPKNAYYADPKVLTQESEADSDVRILSPFDNSVIQRKRLKDLFGYDYQIECYVPAPKRKYGYFCLPVLRKDRFVGRIDAKADREKKELQVISAHWESGFKSTDRDVFVGALERFARFNGCETIKLPARSKRQPLAAR